MHTLKTLSSSLRLLTAPVKGTQTVTVLAMAATGSKYEIRENSGISHFLEHMFFKGTKKRPNASVLSGELDSLGGVYNAFTTKELTGYWAKVDANQAGKAIEILSDMLSGSKFETAEIEREKGVIIEELNMYRDNPMIYIEDVFENLLYGDQPAGWDIIGTKETIRSFKRQDFLAYHKKQYGRQNTIVCLAGNIKGGAEEAVRRHFAALSDAKPAGKLDVKEKQTKAMVKIVQKKTDQAHLSVGVRTFPSNHKDEYIAKLISIILGGSMSSRLFINLRERNGLAYYVRTNAEFYSDHGYLTTQAGVPTDKTEKAIEIILAEYKKLKNSLIKDGELNKFKDMIRGRLVIQLESSDNVANWYTRQAAMKEKIVSPQEYLKKIESVGAKAIRETANEIFVNEKLNLAGIGPIKVEKEISLL